MQLNKTELLKTLLAQLEHALAPMLRAADAARDAATHEEAKPENDKDTRSVEAAYLAGAQAERVAEQREAIARLRAFKAPGYGSETPIGAGALVTVLDSEEEASEQLFFLLPAAGGQRLRVQGTLIRCITPSSPLGRVLSGARVGDVVEFETPRALKEYEILAAD